MAVTYLTRNKRGRLRPETKHNGKSKIHIVLMTDIELSAAIYFYRATKSLSEQLQRLLIRAWFVGFFPLARNMIQILINICTINQRKERQTRMMTLEEVGSKAWRIEDKRLENWWKLKRRNEFVA